MPGNIRIALVVIGSVLLLVALTKGGVQIFGARAEGATGHVARWIAGILGLLLVGYAVLRDPDAPNAAPQVPARVPAEPPAAAFPSSESKQPGTDPAGPTTRTEERFFGRRDVLCTSDGGTEIKDERTFRAPEGMYISEVIVEPVDPVKSYAGGNIGCLELAREPGGSGKATAVRVLAHADCGSGLGPVLSRWQISAYCRAKLTFSSVPQGERPGGRGRSSP